MLLMLAALFGLTWLVTQPGASPFAVGFSDDVDCDDPPDLILGEETGEPMWLLHPDGVGLTERWWRPVS
ncbi:hypothetical protein [Streptomyces phytophilus]|uniref:hypothetical protein n=1 Tax=Streptomyces phytophilus TaxID=722715 RepID=UPI0015F10974|nr:hypothetical protein [Streptomyces phytophilus]